MEVSPGNFEEGKNKRNFIDWLLNEIQSSFRKRFAPFILALAPACTTPQVNLREGKLENTPAGERQPKNKLPKVKERKGGPPEANERLIQFKRALIAALKTYFPETEWEIQEMGETNGGFREEGGKSGGAKERIRYAVLGIKKKDEPRVRLLLGIDTKTTSCVIFSETTMRLDLFIYSIFRDDTTPEVIAQSLSRDRVELNLGMLSAEMKQELQRTLESELQLLLEYGIHTREGRKIGGWGPGSVPEELRHIYIVDLFRSEPYYIIGHVELSEVTGEYSLWIGEGRGTKVIGPTREISEIIRYLQTNAYKL